MLTDAGDRFDARGPVPRFAIPTSLQASLLARLDRLAPVREMAQIGVGMIPRGEVGIVVAQIGLGLGVISGHFFASVLFMAVATTLIAPPLIKVLYSEDRDNDGTEDVVLDIDISEDYTRIG